MKNGKSLFWFAVLLAALLAGCSRKAEDRQPSTDEIGVSFQAKHGLFVPLATAKCIGLETAEVEERKVRSTFQFSAQIYRAAGEATFASADAGTTAPALASGSVSSAQASALREGQSVSVLADGTTLSGHITGVNHDLEKTSGQVEVMLSIAEKKARLLRGAFVSVTVPLGGEKKVITVPRTALLRTTEGDFVYTLSGERFVRTAIKLGVVNDQFAEVIDGLFEGDKIVLQPVMTLWLAELQSIRGGKTCADGH
jgi:multidrug efflux pump subunit AcrA (membrane-fusion protein)